MFLFRFHSILDSLNDCILNEDSIQNESNIEWNLNKNISKRDHQNNVKNFKLNNAVNNNIYKSDANKNKINIDNYNIETISSKTNAHLMKNIKVKQFKPLAKNKR
jgi:hypothetical protein